MLKSGMEEENHKEQRSMIEKETKSKTGSLSERLESSHEVKKTQKSAGSVEIHLKSFDILNVKEGDFVNTIIGNWKPGVDGRPSVEMPSEKEKAVTE